MAHSAAQNAGPGRRRAASRPARAALALVAALALTSVCQGHETGEHRLSPHLAFLAESDALFHDTETLSHKDADTPPGPMYTVAGPGATGAHDVASLGVALHLLTLLAPPARRRWPRPSGERPGDATPLKPEPPPPREV